MGLIQAIVYGIIQGLTEFLPISSTAHIRIVPSLLGWEDPGAGFTAVIQLGTVLAVLIYFAKDLGKAFMAWAKSLVGKEKDTVEARMGWAIFYGTIPIVVLGVLFSDQIKSSEMRSLYVVSYALIAMGIVMWLVDRFSHQTRDLVNVRVPDGIWVGLWQCLALIPGVSRSGSTISGALLRNFDRATAARFSFLLAVPSILGAGLKELYDERHSILSGSNLMPTLVATGVSFVVGYASIAWLIKFLQKHGVVPFVAYRVILGVVLLTMLQQGLLQPESGIAAPAAEPEIAAAR